METDILLPELSFGATVEHLEVQAGDVLIFTAPGIVSQSRLRNLGDEIKVLFPGVTVLVLQEGLQLDRVLRLANSEG